MAEITLSTAARNAAANAIVDLLDAGTGAGYINIYTGTKPAGPDTAISDQTLLATLPMSATAFGAASSGVVSANTITSDTGITNGTAAWARFFDGDDTAVIDVDVGLSTEAIILSVDGTPSVTIGTGDTVAIDSGSFTMPAEAA